MESQIKNTLTNAGVTCFIILFINIICVVIVIVVNKNKNKTFQDRISKANLWMSNINKNITKILDNI